MSEGQDLTQHLGGQWRGHYGTAPCPVCQPEARRDQAALTISDGSQGLLLHCKKSGCRFVDILEVAGFRWRAGRDGTGPGRRRAHQRPGPCTRNAERARQLWEQSIPITGTPAECYLRQPRGITAPLPSTLRFNSGAWHGGVRRPLPALVARIDGGQGFAVLRIWLAPDGSGKADLPSGQQKMMLGPASGGHVLLRDGPGPIVVAEGVETALSLACGLVDEGCSIRAALSATNMASLRLPGRPGHLIIASDGDAAGHAAGEGLAARVRALGWVVEMMPAPPTMDWNDVLLGRHKHRRRSHHVI